MSKKRYWLMKSEPDVYSIDDLKKDKTVWWEGIRNYQARNFMRDDMKLGDEVLFYHSNATPPGVAGLAKICKEAYPDHFALDKKSKYFCKKSSAEKNPWCMVDVQFVKKFKELIPLGMLKETPQLEGMKVIQKGSRLSIQPVEKKHYDFIIKLGSSKI